MAQRSRLAAISHIRSWTTDDVVKVLAKHGLEESCEAFKRREMDGESLLYLTEGKLALWKRDISMPIIRKLSQFVVDINLFPEKYVQAEELPPLPPRPTTPFREVDSDSWDTDFEEEDDHPPAPVTSGFQQKPPLPDRPANLSSLHNNNNNSLHSILHNNVNTHHNNPNSLHSNTSTLHNNTSTLHNNTSTLHNNVSTLRNSPSTIHNNVSTLHNNASTLHIRSTLHNISALHNNASTLLRNSSPLQYNTSALHGLPKPPAPHLESIISELNLNHGDEDDEYHSIDESITTPQALGFPPPRKLTPTKMPPPPDTTVYPIKAPHPRSFPYSLKPPMPLPSSAASTENVISHLRSEAEDVDWEVEDYEVIMDETDYLQPSVPVKSMQAPPPPDLVAPSSHPPTPPKNKAVVEETVESTGGRLSDKLRNLIKARQISGGSTTSTTSGTLEEFGSREKISTPGTSDQKSLPVERPGQRPLPPTPDPSWKGAASINTRKTSRNYTSMPWYHNVDRSRAEELLKNSEDGRFLLRPSAHTHNLLTLTLWYNNRLYNIGVRQRPDQRYALGTEKIKEQSFSSVEEMVQFYQREELFLHSDGKNTGRTLLTTLPRQSS